MIRKMKEWRARHASRGPDLRRYLPGAGRRTAAMLPRRSHGAAIIGATLVVALRHSQLD
jgi:hypothetical protein